ncbi:uL22 family ribosomal protein [Streptomyces sp. O3]
MSVGSPLVKGAPTAQTEGATAIVITHVMVNKAPTIHGRVFRAHGRVTAQNQHPCHIEIVAAEEPGAAS